LRLLRSKSTILVSTVMDFISIVAAMIQKFRWNDSSKIT